MNKQLQRKYEDSILFVFIGCIGIVLMLLGVINLNYINESNKASYIKDTVYTPKYYEFNDKIN